MNGQVTSPQNAGTWKHFAGFLRHPRLPDRQTGLSGAAATGLVRLLALDIAIMAVLIGIAGAATLLGLEMPEHMLDGLALTPILIAFILIGAPIGEEIVFRGWLSGRPGHVGALVILGVAAAGGAFAAALDLPYLLLASAAGGAAAAMYWLWTRRGRAVMPFFARHFGWFYFASTAAFASVHLTNFTEGNALFLLPLVLPQFLFGLILGYARVHYGLWSSVLLHAAHNSLFIGLLLSRSGA